MRNPFKRAQSNASKTPFVELAPAQYDYSNAEQQARLITEYIKEVRSRLKKHCGDSLPSNLVFYRDSKDGYVYGDDKKSCQIANIPQSTAHKSYGIDPAKLPVIRNQILEDFLLEHGIKIQPESKRIVSHRDAFTHSSHPKPPSKSENPSLRSLLALAASSAALRRHRRAQPGSVVETKPPQQHQGRHHAPGSDQAATPVPPS